MQLSLQNLGKKFGREWIFRNLTFELKPGQPVAITGPNGSGKSTLVQVLSGMTLPSEGELTYQQQGKSVAPDTAFKHVMLAAPYLELIEEFTLDELLRFHIRFKALRNGLSIPDFLALLELDHARYKPVQYFSSGMKQRVKLGLALYSEATLVMLDEPTANLDARGAAWYHQHVAKLPLDVTLLIASNQPTEYEFCSVLLNVLDFKGNVRR